MSSYNKRINSVVNEIKPIVKRYRSNLKVFIDFTDLNSVRKGFGGRLSWSERDDVIDRLNNVINGVDCIEYGHDNQNIIIWF